VKPLIGLVQALGPWPSAFLLLGAPLLVCSSLVLIILRSNLALDVHRDAKNKWRVRFVRLERGGRIGDLPAFPESQGDPAKPKRKTSGKTTK
jgi:hypothetical protein